MLNLVKDQKIELTKDNPGMTAARVGLGWDINTGTGDEFDLDVFAIALVNGKSTGSENNVLYYRSPATGNPANAKERGTLGNALIHSGDNLSGEGSGDDETITIDFSKLPADVDTVVVGVTIYEATSRGGQTFGRVKNSYAKIYNGSNNTPVAVYDLNEDYSSYNAITVGRFYRHNGEWKFQAIGTGSNLNLSQIVDSFA